MTNIGSNEKEQRDKNLKKRTLLNMASNMGATLALGLYLSQFTNEPVGVAFVVMGGVIICRVIALFIFTKEGS